MCGTVFSEKKYIHMINIRQSLAIDIAQNTAENLLRELNRHQDISLYRALQFPEVVRWFDEMLFYSKKIEKIIFYKESKEGEWFLDISYRFADKKSFPVAYSIIEEIILPFAPHWTKEFEDNVTKAWEDFSVSLNESAFFESLVKIGVEYAEHIIGTSTEKLSLIFCEKLEKEASKENLIYLQKAIFLLDKTKKKEEFFFDHMPFELIFCLYDEWCKKHQQKNRKNDYFYDKIFHHHYCRICLYHDGKKRP